MNNIESVKNEIETIIRILIESGMSTYQNFPVIKNEGKKQKLEWGSVKNLSIALKNLDYNDIYSEIDRNSDYTIKLIDGNIIQMLYTFERKELISHRLAMFPSPELECYQSEPEIYDKDEIYADIINKKIVPFPIRFDYNKDDINSIHNHPNSHVTLGQYTNCRIPAYGPISPRLFMQFILENFYNTYYMNKYSLSRRKARCLNIHTIKGDECNKIHFNIT